MMIAKKKKKKIRFFIQAELMKNDFLDVKMKIKEGYGDIQVQRWQKGLLGLEVKHMKNKWKWAE